MKAIQLTSASDMHASYWIGIGSLGQELLIQGPALNLRHLGGA